MNGVRSQSNFLLKTAPWAVFLSELGTFARSLASDSFL